MRFIQQVVDVIVVAHGGTAIYTEEGKQNEVEPDDPQVRHQMVQAIIEIGEEHMDRVIHAIFDQVGERYRHRIERRIKFMIHPDRNTHYRAKDAF